MEKVKNNVPYVLFVLLVSKLIILQSTNIYDFLALLAVSAVLCLFELRLENTKFSQLSSKINDLDRKLDEKSKEIDIIKSNFSSMKLSQGLKPMSLNKS